MDGVRRGGGEGMPLPVEKNKMVVSVNFVSFSAIFCPLLNLSNSNPFILPVNVSIQLLGSKNFLLKIGGIDIKIWKICEGEDIEI